MDSSLNKYEQELKKQFPYEDDDGEEEEEIEEEDAMESDEDADSGNHEEL